MTALSRTPSATASAGIGWLDRHDRAAAAGLLAAVVGVGLALRLYTLGGKSLWLDESYSLWMTRQPWGDFWRYSHDLDLHPPLYYVVLRGWSALAGESEVALRLPSVLAGVATLPILYAIGCAVGGRRLGLIAALLLAVSPLHIEYAQQTRMYSLSTLLATGALLCLIHVLTDVQIARPATPATPVGWLRQVATPWWLGFVGCTTLTLLSHNVAVLFAVSIGVFLVGAAGVPGVRARDPSAPSRLGDAALGLGVSVLLWLPWLPVFLRQAAEVDRDFWIPAPTLATSLGYWREIAGPWGSGETFLLPPAPALALLALAGFGVWRLRHRPALVLLLVLVVLVPFVGEQLVSLRRPIFYTRTIIWSTPPFHILLAAGLLGLRIRPLVAGATAALLLYTVSGQPEYYRWDGQENWRATAAYVASRAQPGDVVLISPGWTQLPFDYYESRAGGPKLREYGLPVTLFDRSVLEPIMRPADTTRVDRLIAGSRRVWLLHSHWAYSDPGSIAPEHMGRVMREVDKKDYTSLVVYLYEPREAG